MRCRLQAPPITEGPASGCPVRWIGKGRLASDEKVNDRPHRFRLSALHLCPDRAADTRAQGDSVHFPGPRAGNGETISPRLASFQPCSDPPAWRFYAL